MINDNLVYELIIEDETDEVYAISMVSEPAIEAGWVAFDKESIQFQAVDNDKRLVLGPILVPDKRILRIDGEGKPYHVFLSAPTIKKLSEKYLQNKYTDKVTVEHEKQISDVSLVESWIVESRTKDKSAVYGLSLAPGTWAGTMKVNNEKLWQDFVKTGKLTGFSIEGLFSHQLVAASKEEYLNKEIEDLTEEESEMFLSKIKSMFESYTDYGDAIRNNAKRGIELNEKNGNKCATQTGKIRAQQLANGEPISLETLQRMYSFLSRAETYYDETDSTACGTISFLLWGGKAALSYSRNKLRELGEIDLADIGPKGGIRKSPKAPKSDTKNPNPKGEGSAKGDASGKRGAKVTAEQEKTLQGKVDDFNKKESNTKNGRAGLGALKSVFQRGLGAYNTSRSPAVRSAEQWAYARVNAFLYLLKNGRPENAKYTTDYDLLPKGHPKADTKMEAQPSIPGSSYAGEPASGSIAPATFSEGCPAATQNVALNLYNRSIAVKQAKYGPLNPNEPNDEYWEDKAGEFGGSIEEAKSALCGNCAFFDVRKKTLDCIAKGIGYEDDPELVIEAGGLGYCEAFDFKCAAKRTCSAWVVGGPIKD